MVIGNDATFTWIAHLASVKQVICLSDGRLASCSNSKKIKIWSISNGKLLFELKGHTDEVTSLALLPNGWLASGSRGAIKIWDLNEQKEVRTLKERERSIQTLKVLSNGYLASYSLYGPLSIWDPCLTENNLVLRFDAYRDVLWNTLELGVLSDDSLVTFSNESEDGILHVWDTESGEPIKEIETGLEGISSSLVLLNDTISLGVYDGTIKIVDLSDDRGELMTKELAHNGPVTSMAQLTNGYLVSAGIYQESSYSI